MGYIRTVCGDIAPEELGYTTMHEHTISNPRVLQTILLKSMPDMMKGATAFEGGADIGREKERREREGISGEAPELSIQGVINGMGLPRSNPARKLSDIDFYVNEMKAFREVGGQALVDCSPMPTGASLKVIRELSEKSGVKIISCAGYYTKASIKKKYFKKGEGYLQERVEQYLENGDGSCDARPGFVKCAISVVENEQICPQEHMAVRACAKAAKKYGTALHIHTAFPIRKPLVLDLARELKDEIGIDPTKVVFCHMDGFNIGFGNLVAQINHEGYEIDLPLQLARMGFNIGMDTWGGKPGDDKGNSMEWEPRKKLLIEMFDRGYGDHITLGHDFMSKGGGVQNGGFGCTMFPQMLREMVAEGRLDEAAVHTLTIETPARIMRIER